MKFTVFGTPRPQGSIRAFVLKGRPILTSDNENLRPWRQQVALTLRAEGGEVLLGTGMEAYRISLDFFLERPKSAPKSRTMPTVKPDIDKLVRAILDAGTGVLYGDDAQVVKLEVTKNYGLPERVEIEVEVL